MVLLLVLPGADGAAEELIGLARLSRVSPYEYTDAGIVESGELERLAQAGAAHELYVLINSRLG